MEGMIVLALILGIYWLPTFLAFHRNVSSPLSVGVVNLFLGWTLIGWVVALALSLRTPIEKTAP